MLRFYVSWVRTIFGPISGPVPAVSGPQPAPIRPLSGPFAFEELLHGLAVGLDIVDVFSSVLEENSKYQCTCVEQLCSVCGELSHVS